MNQESEGRTGTGMRPPTLLTMAPEAAWRHHQSLRAARRNAVTPPVASCSSAKSVAPAFAPSRLPANSVCFEDEDDPSAFLPLSMRFPFPCG